MKNAVAKSWNIPVLEGLRRSKPLGAPPTSFNPTYPRKGMYPIGVHTYGSQSWIQAARKWHVIALSHYPGWKLFKNGNVDIVNVCQQIKALSTIGTKIFSYIIYADIQDIYANVSTAEWEMWQRLVNTDQWLYLNGLTRTGRANHVDDGWSKPNYDPSCPVGPDGKTWVRWALERAIRVNRDGGSFSLGNTTVTTAANPYMDGLFIDNVFPWELTEGDYDVNGVTDGINSNASRIRTQQSHAAARAILQQLWPGAPMLANSALWGDQPFRRGIPFAGSPLDQQYEGGVIEHIRQYEIFHSFKVTFDHIMTQMNAFKDPKLGITEVDIESLSNWKLFRYWNGISCMTSSYFYPHAGFADYRSDQIPNTWADEWDVDYGHRVGNARTSATADFFGNASTGEGVYVDEFDEAYVVTGARRGDGYSVTTGDQVTPYGAIPITGRMPTGTRTPSINTGQLVSEISVPPGDARVVMKL